MQSAERIRQSLPRDVLSNSGSVSLNQAHDRGIRRSPRRTVGRLADFPPVPGFPGRSMTCTELGQPSGIPPAHEVRKVSGFGPETGFPGGCIRAPRRKSTYMDCRVSARISLLGIQLLGH